MIGLLKVGRGEMSRKAYVREYGHRGPHEMELSLPRPAEDRAWLDRELEEDGLGAHVQRKGGGSAHPTFAICPSCSVIPFVTMPAQSV